MAAGRSGFTRIVSLCAAAAVVATVGAGISAALVRAGEDSAASGSRTTATAAPDPFASPDAGFDYRHWIHNNDGDGVSYRLPGGWAVSAGEGKVEAADVHGAMVARGHRAAYYFGNDCTDGGRPIAGGWTALIDPVTGETPAGVAEDAALKWASSINHDKQSGAVAPVTAPTTTSVQLADGADAVRSWVSVDMTPLEGSCLPDRAEVAVTAVASGDVVVGLVQGRYVLPRGGVTDARWSAIAASLSVE